MDRRELASTIERIYEVMRSDGLTLVDYVEQLSWLLFLKAFEKLEEDRRLEAEFEGRKYEPVLDPEYSWSTWVSKDMRADQLKSFIETELFPYLSELSTSREKNLISTIFKEVKQKMRDPNNIKQVILMLDKIDFHDPEDSHLLSQIYEETLMMMGREGGAAGEYYTPRPIVKIMTKIVNPKLGKTVFDPFAGSCGFLIESFNLMKAQKKLSVDEWEKLQNDTFFGYELKAIPSLIGIMNCILHGLLNPNIIRRDTFEENVVAVPGERFDFILTNPPFGGSVPKHLRLNLPVSTSSTELGAFEYCMRKLNKDGSCGIVLPEGVLFRGGAYKKVKKQLLEEFNVHTIISLPSGVFAHISPKGGQGPKTDLLFFDKTGPTTEIWYYELTPPNEKKYSKANPITDDDLKDCFEKWKERKVSGNSWIVPVEKIKKSDYDLTARNPKKKEEIEHRPPEKLVAGVLEKEKRISEILGEVQDILAEGHRVFSRGYKKRWKWTRLGDSEVVELIMGQSPPSSTYNENRKGLPFFQGKVDFGLIYPTPRKWCDTPQKIALPNDVLISVRAPTGPVNICKEKCCIGRGLAAIRVKKGLYYKFLFYFLRYVEPEIAGRGKGSTFGAITKKRLELLKIPLPLLEEQKRIVAYLDKLQEKVEALKKYQIETKDEIDSITASVLDKAFKRELVT